MAQLRLACGASYPTIRKALNGTVTTVTHLRIREKALELGGAEIRTAAPVESAAVNGGAAPAVASAAILGGAQKGGE